MTGIKKAIFAYPRSEEDRLLRLSKVSGQRELCQNIRFSIQWAYNIDKVTVYHASKVSHLNTAIEPGEILFITSYLDDGRVTSEDIIRWERLGIRVFPLITDDLDMGWIKELYSHDIFTGIYYKDLGNAETLSDLIVFTRDRDEAMDYYGIDARTDLDIIMDDTRDGMETKEYHPRRHKNISNKQSTTAHAQAPGHVDRPLMPVEQEWERLYDSVRFSGILTQEIIDAVSVFTGACPMLKPGDDFAITITPQVVQKGHI